MMRRRRSAPLLALAAILLAGCGGDDKSTTSSAVPTTGAGTPPPAAGTGPGWTTFAGSGARTGVAPGAPAAPKLRESFRRGLDGEVYAQPLVAGGRIYVATENNTVYAFTTAGKRVWQRHLGDPVPGGDLPCGNIDPSGITGTPAIAGGRIYAVAFLGSSHTHELFGLRLRDGGIAVRTNVDPPNPLVHQERGALLAAHGRIYVPYGGLFGDCGDYRGVVVSTRESGGGRSAYVNPANMAGIWSPGGLSAQSGTLLVTTGNGTSDGFAYANSVIRLSPDLKRVGYWAPRNWEELSAGDVDEGSLAPLPVSRGRVFQIGKDGVGYLLSEALGGIGGEQFSAQVCDGQAFGADAFAAPLAIVPCGDALYALRIGADRFDVAWKSDAGGRVPVIAGNSVFAITPDGTLKQLSLKDGHEIASADVGSQATSFPAPAAAGHTLVAPAGRGIVVFSI